MGASRRGRAARFREPATRLAHLLVLSGVRARAAALRHPRRSTRSSSPCAARRRPTSSSSRSSVTFVPALVLSAVELRGRRPASARAGLVLHLVFFGGLFAAFAIQVLGRLGLDGTVVLIGGAVGSAGVAAAVALWRTSLVGSFLDDPRPRAARLPRRRSSSSRPSRTSSSPTRSRSRRLRAGSEPRRRSSCSCSTSSRSSRCSTATGRSTQGRYPNFARLARESTWFRNTTTLSAQTTPRRARDPEREPARAGKAPGLPGPSAEPLHAARRALPAERPGVADAPLPERALRRRRARHDRAALVPLRGRPRRLRAPGRAARARRATCPRSTRPGRASARRARRSRTSTPPPRPPEHRRADLLPRPHPRLQPTSCARSSAGGGRADAQPPAPPHAARALALLPRRARERGRAAPGARPGRRALVGRGPRRTRPTSATCSSSGTPTGCSGASSPAWRRRGSTSARCSSSSPTTGSRFAATTIAACRPRRTSQDLAFVPFFVKLPGERKGQVVDRHVRIVDVLPTIADALDVELPWKVDGRSGFAEGEGADTVRVGPARRRPTTTCSQRRDEALRAPGRALRRRQLGSSTASSPTAA